MWLLMWWLVRFEFFFGFEFCYKICISLWVWLDFFGFEFCCKIWVLLLWVWLGLCMGKIGVDLRLETKISEEWSKGEERERRD